MTIVVGAISFSETDDEDFDLGFPTLRFADRVFDRMDFISVDTLPATFVSLGLSWNASGHGEAGGIWQPETGLLIAIAEPGSLGLFVAGLVLIGLRRR